MHHPIGGVEFLVWEIFMAHDECIGRWTPPPHHPKIVPYKHQHLHPLPMIYVRPIFPNEGGWVHHLGNFWGFGPMYGSEACGSWHCVLLIFAIFMIIWISEWTTPDYQNSIFLMNETRNVFPGDSHHEEHDVKTSGSDAHVQHEIWMLPRPNN